LRQLEADLTAGHEHDDTSTATDSGTFPEVRDAAGRWQGCFMDAFFKLPQRSAHVRTDIGVQGRKFTEMLEL